MNMPFDVRYDTDRVPRDPETGSVPVVVQDQTTPMVPADFAASVSSFNLFADTTASTISVLNYEMQVVSGNGLLADDDIILLDTAATADRSLQCRVLSVTADVGFDRIVIDRPIDHVFPVDTTLGRKTDLDLTVNGSVTAAIYSIRAGAKPRDFFYYTLQFEHASASATDSTKFCGLAPLTRGLCVRIVNGYQQTNFNFKTDGDVERYGGTVKTTQKTGGGNYVTLYRIPVKDVFGVVQRISGTSAIQVIVQDDLTSLISGFATASGHITQGEV
jgi:hypothetical protein